MFHFFPSILFSNCGFSISYSLNLQVWMTFSRVSIQMANFALVYKIVNGEQNSREVIELPPLKQRKGRKKSDWHQFLL